MHAIMNTLIINIAMEMKEDLHYTGKKFSLYLIIIFQVVLFIEPGKLNGKTQEYVCSNTEYHRLARH